MDNIRRIISEMDVMPYQISIEAKVVEVFRDVLRDIGLEWGSGPHGTTLATYQKLSESGSLDSPNAQGIGRNWQGYNSTMVPSAFSPNSNNLTPANSGLNLGIQRLLNTQFEAILHMLEENCGANILSAPKIMAYSNQEASIIIGTQYPIVTTSITTGTTATTTVQLDYYQNIGVRLSVIPQVSDDKYINMMLHPAVTTSTSDLEIKNDGGFTIAKYPIIQTREADTRVLMQDGETIVIGGLLKDEKKETRIGVPFLSDLPFVGAAFRRTTTDTKKMDLLIFVTAHIVLKGSDTGRNAYSYLISKQQAEQLLKKEPAAPAEVAQEQPAGE
ncbi:MAG TPA: hypothetical protein P5287_04255, partial [bacterium]|nr:hypothetical protein [bacterium]